MHDRRIADGRTLKFGNQGWLYMRAMTWWDWETDSIWSQPIGTALVGPLRGTKLRLLSSALVPWKSWQQEHPDTTVLAVDGFTFFKERPHDNFVVGIALGEHAKAYRYRDMVKARVVNDRIGPHPIVVYADPTTRRVQTFSRTVQNRELTFQQRNGSLVDDETGSTWDPVRGLATTGPLRGEALRIIPHNSSFDWAWLDFYPNSEFYKP